MKEIKKRLTEKTLALKLEKIAAVIRKSRSVAISGHINPDGDSLGSLLSLGLGLKQLKKRVYMLCLDEIPSAFLTLPGVSQIVHTTKENVDLAIAVDCGDVQLLGESNDVFKRANIIAEIDHHSIRKPFGDINLVEPEAAAVGELVYFLLKILGVKITRAIAENILTSIIVETNSFKLNRIQPFIFKLCAELVACGVDFTSLSDKVYWSRTKESVVLSGRCMARCKFLSGEKIVWSIIYRRDFIGGGKNYDVDAVANELRLIKGVRLVIVFREESPSVLRVSLRSRGKVNAARLAKRFGGGGHFDIAGCVIDKSKKAIRFFLAAAQELTFAHTVKKLSATLSR